MINTRNRLDKLVIGSAFTLGSINEVQANFNMEVLSNFPGGHIAPMCIANLLQQPQIRVTTPEIDTVLAAVPVNGYATTNDSYLYQKLATATGTVARATTSHTRHVLSAVTTYWTTVNLQHNQESTLELMVVPVWDGSADIIAPSGSVALTGNLACNPRYGAGPVSINGTAINGIQSIEWSSGAQVQILGASSEVWPTSVSIQRVAPMCRIVTTDIQLATIGIAGTALDETNGLIGWARRHKSADASTHHIKGQILNGIVHVESETGSSPEDYRATLVIHGSSASDSVMPLVFTTGLAIT